MGMTAARKLKTTAHPYDLISPEEYLATEIDSPVKREYYQGHVYAMTGAINQHNRIAGNVYSTLDRLLRDHPCVPINSDTKIRIREGRGFRFYYPDAGVVCEENPRTDHFQDKPTLVVEVLSASTRRVDESEKRLGYQSIPSLQSYLLVHQDQPAVVHYRRTKSGFRAAIIQGLDEEVAIPALSISIPLAEIYRRISFAAE